MKSITDLISSSSSWKIFKFWKLEPPLHLTRYTLFLSLSLWLFLSLSLSLSLSQSLSLSLSISQSLSLYFSLSDYLFLPFSLYLILSLSISFFHRVFEVFTKLMGRWGEGRTYFWVNYMHENKNVRFWCNSVFVFGGRAAISATRR